MFKKLKIKKFNLAIAFLFALTVSAVYVQNVSADDADPVAKEKQIAEINNNLKNVIQENQRLAKRNKEQISGVVFIKSDIFLLFIYLPMVPKYEVFILFNNKILYKYHATDVFPFVPVTAIVLFGNFE